MKLKEAVQIMTESGLHWSAQIAPSFVRGSNIVISPGQVVSIDDETSYYETLIIPPNISKKLLQKHLERKVKPMKVEEIHLKKVETTESEQIKTAEKQDHTFWVILGILLILLLM